MQCWQSSSNGLGIEKLAWELCKASSHSFSSSSWLASCWACRAGFASVPGKLGLLRLCVTHVIDQHANDQRRSDRGAVACSGKSVRCSRTWAPVCTSGRVYEEQQRSKHGFYGTQKHFSYPSAALPPPCRQPRQPCLPPPPCHLPMRAPALPPCHGCRFRCNCTCLRVTCLP